MTSIPLGYVHLREGVDLFEINHTVPRQFASVSRRIHAISGSSPRRTQDGNLVRKTMIGYSSHSPLVNWTRTYPVLFVCLWIFRTSRRTFLLKLDTLV